jgi:hypothetical protein
VSKAREPKVSSKLGKYINKLLDEVMADEPKPKEGEAAKDPKYSITDKMKVIDRALKYEAIKLKVPGSGEGGFFSQPAGADDNGDS